MECLPSPKENLRWGSPTYIGLKTRRNGQKKSMQYACVYVIAQKRIEANGHQFTSNSRSSHGRPAINMHRHDSIAVSGPSRQGSSRRRRWPPLSGPASRPAEPLIVIVPWRASQSDGIKRSRRRWQEWCGRGGGEFFSERMSRGSRGDKDDAAAGRGEFFLGRAPRCGKLGWRLTLGLEAFCFLEKKCHIFFSQI